MKKIFFICMMLTAMLFFRDGDSEAMQGKVKFYQMTYQTDNVAGNIEINGFVITEITGKTGNGTAVLNPWLVGENELKAVLKKADPSRAAEFAFGISEMVQGDIVSTADKGKILSVEIKNKDFSPDGKAFAERKFKSGLDFKRHLIEAGKAKESDVIAYAKKLYALFAQKNAEGILRESEIKIKDYSEAFGGADMKTELRKYLTEELFRSKLNKLNSAALRAVAVGPAKNIWHVYNGRDELIKAKSADGSTYELAVYVGLLDGKLKVVR